MYPKAGVITSFGSWTLKKIYFLAFPHFSQTFQGVSCHFHLGPSATMYRSGISAAIIIFSCFQHVVFFQHIHILVVQHFESCFLRNEYYVFEGHRYNNISCFAVPQECIRVFENVASKCNVPGLVVKICFNCFDHTHMIIDTTIGCSQSDFQ